MRRTNAFDCQTREGSVRPKNRGFDARMGERRENKERTKSEPREREERAKGKKKRRYRGEIAKEWRRSDEGVTEK